MSRRSQNVPLVAHVIHRFGTGGMENGLVNILNRMPADRYRHVLVCLADAGPFVGRIRRDGVQVVALNRRPGKDVALYGRVWSALRKLKPAIVHTRNLSALEAQIPAALLGGVKRVHGEHGRDVFDLTGSSRKYNLLRRAIRPLVHRYVAVSRDLASWLEATVGVRRWRIRQIYNGVDSRLFHPGGTEGRTRAPAGFSGPQALVVGTVGRLAEVKDQQTLLRAFALIRADGSDVAHRLWLAVVGDGNLRRELERLAGELGIADRVWFAGDRDDVADLLREMDLFVLPSLAEGISNTILEAMATGLPVIATRVGGTPELVTEGLNGLLVPAAEPEALARAIGRLVADEDLRMRYGAAARREVQTRFDWDRCTEAYLGLYDELLVRAAGQVSPGGRNG